MKQGTSAVLLQSSLDEKWWADSMECYTYLRNIQDLLSDGPTHMRDALENPVKDQSFRLVHWLSITLFLRKTSQESVNLERKCYLDCSLDTLCTREEFASDIMVADIEELESMDASEIYSKRLNAKEVIFSRENGKFIFPVASGRIKFNGGDQDLRTSTLTRDHPIRGEIHVDFLENQKGLHLHHLKTRIRMPVKQEMIFGPCQETSFSAITLNPESNFSRREKNHSLFH